MGLLRMKERFWEGEGVLLVVGYMVGYLALMGGGGLGWVGLGMGWNGIGEGNVRKSL